MEIVEKRQEKYYLFKLNGRLDSNTSPEFEEKVFNAVDDGNVRLIIDCGQMDYITSAGLRVLNKTAKRLKRDDGGIVLFPWRIMSERSLRLQGLTPFYPLWPPWMMRSCGYLNNIPAYLPGHGYPDCHAGDGLRVIERHPCGLSAGCRRYPAPRHFSPTIPRFPSALRNWVTETSASRECS